MLDAKTALTTANMTEHGRVGKLTEPQKVILKQMDKNMKDIKKIRKMLQQKDKIQNLERYTTYTHEFTYFIPEPNCLFLIEK